MKILRPVSFGEIKFDLTLKNSNILYLSSQLVYLIPAPLAQSVESPLRGTGGHGFEVGSESAPGNTRMDTNLFWPRSPDIHVIFTS